VLQNFDNNGNMNAGRDINIIDNSNNSKLLIDCTNSELHIEREHRTNLLRQERKAKWKRLATLWMVFAVVGSAVALYFYFIKGNTNLSSIILGLAGIAASVASVKLFEAPTQFEARQIAALNEISMILRERGGNP